MNSSDLLLVKKFYDSRVQACHDPFEALGWRDQSSQFLRFEVLFRNIDVTGFKILDLGCGYGDLVRFLDTRTSMFSYIGVDISGAMLAKARERYGHDDRVQFIEGDILNLDLKHAGIDFAVESGAFTYRVKDNWQLMYDSLHRMFDIAHKGVAANFMTSYVDYELPKNFHYAPEKVLSFCKQLTRYVNLIHDYPLYEFTVQIFK